MFFFGTLSQILIQYSLIGILKPKFTRGNEIWSKITEKENLSKNVRKRRIERP